VSRFRVGPNADWQRRPPSGPTHPGGGYTFVWIDADVAGGPRALGLWLVTDTNDPTGRRLGRVGWFCLYCPSDGPSPSVYVRVPDWWRAAWLAQEPEGPLLDWVLEAYPGDARVQEYAAAAIEVWNRPR
jgi:hypothetical protein